MILGDAAIFLNLLSITAFSVLLLVAALSIFVKLKTCVLDNYSASSRRHILWLVALSPWFVGLLAATLAIASGSPYLPLPQAWGILHWHHPQEFIFNSWHGLSTFLAVSYTAFLFIRNIRRLISNNRQVKLLDALAIADDNGFYQLDADAPTAFTAGFSQPRCYITSGLCHHLDDQEYTIVQLHEEAHAKRLDPLKKWFFQLLTSFFPLGVSTQLNQSMALAMEQCADAAVSRVIADKSLIAMTLLKVRRLAVMPFENTLDDAAVCHYGHDNIAARISYLLTDQQAKGFPYFMVVIAAVLLSVACTLSVDIFHHVIEYSLSH